MSQQLMQHARIRLTTSLVSALQDMQVDCVMMRSMNVTLIHVRIKVNTRIRFSIIFVCTGKVLLEETAVQDMMTAHLIHATMRLHV